MPAMKTYREAMFSGWFGPMGVGAVFLSMIAKEELEEIYHDSTEKPLTIELVSPVVLFIVLSSTLVHGTTIPLFKIGKRIRTRTLSIASTGSGQVRRLPKLQFGKSDDKERDNSQDSEAMSQLKRNTLANTIQYDPLQKPASHTIDMDQQQQSDDEDLKEEDFLPDEDPNDEPQTEQQQHHLSVPTVTTTSAEPQSIRFVEPVNPRNNSLQPPLHHHHRSQSVDSNVERNETSVSSFRSWMRNNNSKEEGDVGIVASNPPAGGGLRNLFRRHNQEQQPTTEEEAPPQHREHAMDKLKDVFSHLTQEEKEEKEIIDLGQVHLDPRIQVWDEPNHVIIEDEQDAASHSVIDKSEHNWEYAVKERVKEIQQNIEQQK